MSECGVIEKVLSGDAVKEFISECRLGLCRGLSEPPLINKALSKLIGDGLNINTLPNHVAVRFKSLIMGFGEGIPLARISRLLFGIRALGPDGRELSYRELLSHVKVKGFSGLTLIKYGGACEWLCGYVAKLINDVFNHLSRVSGESIGTCVNDWEVGYAESLKVLETYIPEPGGDALKLANAIKALCDGVVKVLPGVNSFTTYALMIRFTSIPALMETLRRCLGVKGREAVKVLRKLLRPASPALMDLRRCVIYGNVDEVPAKELSRNEYLVTIYRRVVRREIRYEDRYDVVGEEVMTSPVYGLINVLVNQWPEFEDSVLGIKSSIKLIDEFINENVKNVLNTGDKVVINFLRRLRYEGMVKLTSIPGKDEFSNESLVLALKLSPLITSALLEASAGWDGVRFGNAVINRYALRFRFSNAARRSGIVGRI